MQPLRDFLAGFKYDLTQQQQWNDQLRFRIKWPIGYLPSSNQSSQKVGTLGNAALSDLSVPGASTRQVSYPLNQNYYLNMMDYLDQNSPAGPERINRFKKLFSKLHLMMNMEDYLELGN